MLSVIAVIADVLGIASFCLTIVLLIRSETLRKEIEGQREDYTNEQNDIKAQLSALRSNIIEDNLLSMSLISDTRTQLYKIKQKYGHLLNSEDRKHLKVGLAHLEKSVESISKTALCAELDYFVARFERKEWRL